MKLRSIAFACAFVLALLFTKPQAANAGVYISINFGHGYYPYRSYYRPYYRYRRYYYRPYRSYYSGYRYRRHRHYRRHRYYRRHRHYGRYRRY